MRVTSLLALTLPMLFMSVGALAYNPDNSETLAHETPKNLEGIGITEKLGHTLDFSTSFVDDRGQAVTLGQYFTGEKPVLLSMVYYSCPSLCNYHLNGLLDVFKKMQWTAGKDFEVVAVSMDHKESHELASQKKASYLKEYGRSGASDGWHFLTGAEENVKKLADEIGFGFRWDEESQQFAHASAAQIVTPSGKISRYLYGIEFNPQTVKLSLLEASSGKIGNVVDQLILFCFQFDPAKNKYTLYAYRLMQIGGLLTVVVLAIVLIPMWLRERNQPRTTA